MPSSDDHRITLVRHGETTGQSSIRYYGATDVPLSAEGEEQMSRVGAHLAGSRFDRVFTSELSRTRRAAELIAPQGPEAIHVSQLNEINFGRWEGWTKEEIASRDPQLFQQWQDNPIAFTYPEGDCRTELGERIRAAFASLIEQHPAGRWLMVLHRGVIAALLTDLIGPDATGRLRIDLASIHTVVRDDGRWLPERLDQSAA